ncbi:hypothetical protein SNE40_010879 [Patella caerulea]|uniref:Uncharacterized protein n=1 Tax=Patella caerulea TaxID=87958 RepID=A0AAN8PT96_PATCE
MLQKVTQRLWSSCLNLQTSHSLSTTYRFRGTAECVGLPVLSNRQPLPHCLAMMSVFNQQRRGNSNYGLGSKSTESGDRQSENMKKLQILTTDAAWSVRLANENGYLSWCRNTYLCSAVGVMMTTQTANIAVQYAASGAFMVSGLNLSMGTLSYIYYLLSLRQHANISFTATFIAILFALLHFCAWAVVLIFFMGNQDDTIAFLEIEGPEFDKEDRA